MAKNETFYLLFARESLGDKRISQVVRTVVQHYDSGNSFKPSKHPRYPGSVILQVNLDSSIVQVFQRELILSLQKAQGDVPESERRGCAFYTKDQLMVK